MNEDDRAEIGKGHEFPTQLFKSHYNMPTLRDFEVRLVGVPRVGDVLLVSATSP